MKKAAENNNESALAARVECCSTSHDREYEKDEVAIKNNEYVLNIAFLSFLGFTTLQLVFALLAHSQSMLTDCAAMYVDVMSYLVNYMAERLKYGHSEKTVQELRLRRLYLELVPPLVSVATLVGVTIVSLQQACEILLKLDNQRQQANNGDDETTPDLSLMLLFSALNLLLDFINVSCFARVDQAVGIGLGQKGEEKVHVHSQRKLNKEEQQLVASEKTKFIAKENHYHDDDETSEYSDEEHQGLNLNMCSAWTHICADTLRSIAVLVAAGFATLFPQLLSPTQADSWGSVIVSIIILVSLVPLIQGLYLTACKIRAIWKQEENDPKNQKSSSAAATTTTTTVHNV